MKAKYLDLTERVVVTFLQGFLATWIVTGDLDETTLKVAALAGAISAAKCLLAFNVGSSNTAALLPAGPDTDKGGDDRGASDVAVLVLGLLMVIVVLAVIGAI